MARKGRFVCASCRSHVAPPSLVRKMRPSSPIIQPSFSEGKQVAKRFWRTSPRWTGSAPARAAQAITSAATTNFMRNSSDPGVVCFRCRADGGLYRTVSFRPAYPRTGRSVNDRLRQGAPAKQT
jgi:hypothetical protein